MLLDSNACTLIKNKSENKGILIPRQFTTFSPIWQKAVKSLCHTHPPGELITPKCILWHRGYTKTLINHVVPFGFRIKSTPNKLQPCPPMFDLKIEFFGALKFYCFRCERGPKTWWITRSQKKLIMDVKWLWLTKFAFWQLVTIFWIGDNGYTWPSILERRSAWHSVINVIDAFCKSVRRWYS